jgi:hypothetical protein
MLSNCAARVKDLDDPDERPHGGHVIHPVAFLSFGRCSAAKSC